MARIARHLVNLNAFKLSGRNSQIFEFEPLHPNASGVDGHFEFIASNNSNLSILSFQTLAIAKAKLSPGWVCATIKPYSNQGIGPLHAGNAKGTAICISYADNPIWTIDTTGGVYYSIIIRASLLAKHALSMIDTSVLKAETTLTLSAEVTSRLIEKLNQIAKLSRHSAELDLRTSHLMLAICESIASINTLSSCTESNTCTEKGNAANHDKLAGETLRSNHQMALNFVDLTHRNPAAEIDEICKILAVSKSSLQKIIKSRIGITASRYLKIQNDRQQT